MRTPEARNWADNRHGAGQTNPRLKEQDLECSEVNWIMEVEQNATQLMTFEPANGRIPARWLIRQGNYISLGELFVHGADLCSCWDLYRTYTSLEVFIARKNHSVSNTENGIFRQNAKRVRHAWCGRWGLPQ